MSTKPLYKKRHLELDALRGIAALMVVLFHYTLYRPEADLVFKFGTTGVDLFFMISGFVILMSIEHVNNAREFIVNRISRLYPTYWACVSITFLTSLLFISSHQLSFSQWLINMTMFQYYFKTPNIDEPYWTMIIEMVFYISMIILYHLKLLNKLTAVGLGVSILTVIVVSLFYENSITRKVFYGIPLLQYTPLFLAGTIFYRFINGQRSLLDHIIVITCLIIQVLLFEYSGRSHLFIERPAYVILLCVYFGLFYVFAYGRLGFIVNKATLFFGKISFALYLIHYKISVDIIIPYLTENLHASFLVASCISLAIIVALASVITYLVEIPGSKKLKTFLNGLY